MDLFVYGTLMVPEVMAAVCAHCGPGEPATLVGYRRRRLIGESYPAIVPCSGDQVVGICHSGLNAAQVRLLDAFEGDIYRRRGVSVQTTSGERPAETYVLAPRFATRLSREPWSLEAFVASHKDGFLRDYGGFSALPVKG